MSYCGPGRGIVCPSCGPGRGTVCPTCGPGRGALYVLVDQVGALYVLLWTR